MDLVGKSLFVKILSPLSCFNSVHAFIGIFHSTDFATFLNTVLSSFVFVLL